MFEFPRPDCHSSQFRPTYRLFNLVIRMASIGIRPREQLLRELNVKARTDLSPSHHLMWLRWAPFLLSLRVKLIIIGILLATSCVPGCVGYSVLTHEAIIDA